MLFTQTIRNVYIYYRSTPTEDIHTHFRGRKNLLFFLVFNENTKTESIIGHNLSESLTKIGSIRNHYFAFLINDTFLKTNNCSLSVLLEESEMIQFMKEIYISKFF